VSGGLSLGLGFRIIVAFVLVFVVVLVVVFILVDAGVVVVVAAVTGIGGLGSNRQGDVVSAPRHGGIGSGGGRRQERLLRKTSGGGKLGRSRRDVGSDGMRRSAGRARVGAAGGLHGLRRYGLERGRRDGRA
jgi:hypothetical protein